MLLPKGFTDLSFRSLLVLFSHTTLAAQLYDHLGLFGPEARSRIEALEQQKLIQFAVSPSQEPSVFIAPKAINGRDLYQSDEDHAFAESLVNFWDIQGKFTVEGGQIVESETFDAASLVARVYTPEGDVGVVTRVAQKLRDLNLLTQDAQGHYHGPSKTEVMQWVEEHGICDFCSDPNPHHTEIVPDFELMPGTPMPTSIGGWATCDTCHTLIAENRRTDLFQRAITASRGGKFTAAALKGLHQKFWSAWDSKVDAAGVGSALIDFIDGKLQDVDPTPELKERSKRAEAIRRLTGLTHEEMDALGKGDVLYKDIAKKLSVWRKKFGTDGYAGAKKIAEMLNAEDRPKLHPGYLPHWQIALDQKVAAINALKIIEKLPGDVGTRWQTGEDVKWMDLQDDLNALRVAEVYSFNADTIHAIRMGSQSIPHESTLKSVEIPTVRAGWFWFAEPLPITPSPLASDTTAALLWSWDPRMKTPALRFSAYVLDDKRLGQKPGTILPSAKWAWPIEMSFDEMLAFNRQLYQGAYGEGGPFANREHQFLIGEDETLKCVAELSLFFLMSCLWFKQTVPSGSKKKVDPKLTQTPGHIERHARKRYEKEFKHAPSVRVIALRKSVVVEEAVKSEGQEPTHHLKVRFVVSGHARLQPCGPGHKDRKLIWVDPFVKGPENAPFKETAVKVFAVVR